MTLILFVIPWLDQGIQVSAEVIDSCLRRNDERKETGMTNGRRQE
jgi:hypothetical protein